MGMEIYYNNFGYTVVENVFSEDEINVFRNNYSKTLDVISDSTIANMATQHFTKIEVIKSVGRGPC